MERRALPSHPRYSADAAGNIYGKTGKPLRLFAGTGGYLRFTTYEAGRWQQVSVHVMVCEAFHGPRPDGHHAAHKNGVCTDNRASNLSWKTARQNETDKREHGRSLQGERHHQHKLTEEEVRFIRAPHGITDKALADRYGVSRTAIGNARRGKSWSHIQ